MAVVWERYYSRFDFSGRIPASRWPARLKYNNLVASHTLPSSGRKPIDNTDHLLTKAEDFAASRVRQEFEQKQKATEAKLNELTTKLERATHSPKGTASGGGASGSGG
jgi:hypothetical protein